MKVDEALPRLSRFDQVVLIVSGADGYPLSVATDFQLSGDQIELGPVSLGTALRAHEDARLIFSHIRPKPGEGYDERRYIELAGVLESNGALRFKPQTARGWDEQELSFFELCERALPQARRYLRQLSTERGAEVKPKMAAGWRFFLATRLPFLTATLVPVLLGIALAGYERSFSLGLALLSLLAAICIHLGLNVANDVFDTLSGADELNVTPTMFSGGSRVLQYGLVSLRQMASLSAAFYVVGAVIGLYFVLTRGIGLLWLGLAGILISIFYTAPPLKLVHRGLGELCVALGFGPIMLEGAYFVQTQHYSWPALVLSIPVAIMVMLILYANEIPDRIADEKAGKRTLVVRMSKDNVITGYWTSVALAYLVIAFAAIFRVLPLMVLLGLLTIPLAVKAGRGLREHYESPYQLMPDLQTNIVLHLLTGILLFAGLLIAIVIR
jgi:1,4-dihydroxy-2-naphthoate octaprenyltransferase